MKERQGPQSSVAESKNTTAVNARSAVRTRKRIALYKLHHWAFDYGWISVSDNYEILVKNKQHRSEAKEFGQLEGNKIQLPDNEENRPLPKFLRKHRDLHNFDPT